MIKKINSKWLNPFNLRFGICFLLMFHISCDQNQIQESLGTNALIETPNISIEEEATDNLISGISNTVNTDGWKLEDTTSEINFT